jgi:hypothetical protein
VTFDQITQLFSEDRYDEAIDALMEIIKKEVDPTTEQLDARLYLANIYSKLSKHEEAKDQVKEVVMIMKKPKIK